ncbi:beta-galactosidase trimerization domain-containing protein, partial [bacterium]|nr:beta-galactosidase trimerization domain-containing protein [bacterium]
MTDASVPGAARPWWHESLRILDVVYQPRLATIDVEEIGRWCTDFHANAIHFHCHDSTHGGLRAELFYHRSRLATRENRDLLAEFLPVARRLGVRVVVYLNGHWFSKSFLDDHPDWAVIKADGTRLDHLYGTDDSTCCVNAPWRDWMFQLIEDVCAYEVDGVFFDGPITFLGRQGCYCRWCREKFRRQHGREMPPWDRTKLADWRFLSEFSAGSLVDYYRDAYAVSKRARPAAAVYLNACNLAEAGWAAGRGNRALLPYTDILAAEGGFHYTRLAANPWKTSGSGKLYLSQAGDKPAVNAVAAAYNGWRRCSLTAAELRLLVATAGAGTSPYIGLFEEALGQQSIAAIQEVYAFLERQADRLRGTRSLARAAILQSTQTLNYYAGVDIPWADLTNIKAQQADSIGNYSRSFWGYYELLVRLRIPFDVLDEESLLDGQADPYRLLVLPNCACLSEAQVRALAGWVERGGCLLSEFETSHYDEAGQRLRDFGLADVFGAQSRNEISGPHPHDFLDATGFAARHAAALDTLILPSPRHRLRVVTTTGDAAIRCCRSLASNIPSVLEPSDEPFLVENRFGAGRSCYLAGTFGELYQTELFTWYRQVVGAIVAEAAPAPVRIAGVPHLLEVMLHEQPATGRRLVFLLNHELQAVDEVIPAEHVEVALRGGDRPGTVRALRAGLDLAWREWD